jgi:hypothetical protein
VTPEHLETKIKEIFPTITFPIPAQLKSQKLDLDKLSKDQIFTLTAWEFWKDGQDWDQGISDIAEGHDVILCDRAHCITALKNIFGY